MALSPWDSLTDARAVVISSPMWSSDLALWARMSGLVLAGLLDLVPSVCPGAGVLTYLLGPADGPSAAGRTTWGLHLPGSKVHLVAG